MNSYTVTVIGYLFFVVTGVWLWFFTRGGRNDQVAGLRELLGRLLRFRVTRLAIFFSWWWLGWHFIVNVITRSL